MKNIYAYTELGFSLPAFVSLNLLDGKRILSVRSRGSEVPATIELDASELEVMAADILNHLHSYDDAEGDQTETVTPKTRGQMKWDTLNDNSCVGAFARAKP